jgi:hypothetical protein
MDVLLPGTMVKHCVSFWVHCLDFCIMPKEVYLDVLVLNDIGRLGPAAIIMFIFIFLFALF